MSKDKYVLPITLDGFGQPNSKSCWYACYAMMYAWKNKTTGELDQNLAKAGYKLSEIKNRGLVDTEYKKVANAVGLVGVQRIAALNWSIEDVAYRLEKWGPIFLSTMEHGGHAMLLYGVDKKLELLIVADPYSVGGDLGSAHNEYFSLQKFRGTIQPVDFALQAF